MLCIKKISRELANKYAKQKSFEIFQSSGNRHLEVTFWVDYFCSEEVYFRGTLFSPDDEYDIEREGKIIFKTYTYPFPLLCFMHENRGYLISERLITEGVLVVLSFGEFYNVGNESYLYLGMMEAIASYLNTRVEKVVFLPPKKEKER